jgi:hypothetical protein
MSADRDLIQLAVRHKLGIYFCGRAKRSGKAHIQILRDKSVLAEFSSLADALDWFPKIAVPVAAGTVILKPTAT